MKTYLKVKLKHLEQETKIIKHEERKWPGESKVRLGLYTHRINDVKSEIRATAIAYGFLRGRPYSRIESEAKRFPPFKIWNRVQRMVEKYGKEYFPTENDLWSTFTQFKIDARMFIKNRETTGDRLSKASVDSVAGNTT